MGELRFENRMSGLNTDPAAVPDPEHFVACIEAGFDEILRLDRAHR